MDNKNSVNKKEQQKLQLAQTNRALGIFILFFGVIIIISVFFTETFVGRMTNLVAGLILCTIGGIMILKGKKNQKAS